MNKIQLIAEIGWNAIGDMNLIKKMIKSAAENGADWVKTQVFNEKYLKPGSWDKDGRREIYKKAQLNYEQLVEMKKYCEENNVKFLASVMSVRDAKLYARVTNEVIKIPSFESRNEELLKFAVKNFDKVIMSCGTSTIEEIKKILLKFGYKELQKFILLHCISSYPCLPKNANLEKINKLRKIFDGEVGWSDHTLGNDISKITIAKYNVTLIEKHFTTDRSLPGRDNKFACLPEELKDLTNFIKIFELAIQAKEDYQTCEKEARELQTGRFAIDEKLK